MSTKDHQAFPIVAPDNFSFADNGLTRRELFAAMAMQGILASLPADAAPKAELLAKEAVGHADALIALLDE